MTTFGPAEQIGSGDLAIAIPSSGAAIGKVLAIVSGSGDNWQAALIDMPPDLSSAVAAILSVLSDQTGTGPLVFANGPTLTAPSLGTPASGNLANCTFPTLNQNTTGSAAKLTTARTINGVAFDGTTNIVVTAAGSTLSDTVPIGKGGTGLTALGSALQVLRVNAGATAMEWASGGTGDVVGPSSATDNSVARFDTTTGKLIQSSSVAIDDSGNVSIGTGVSPPIGSLTQYVAIIDSSSGAKVPGLVFGGNGGGGSSVGEILFTGGGWSFGRMKCLATSGGGSGTGNIYFYVVNGGVETAAMILTGPGQVSFGDTTSAAAASLKAHSFSFSGTTYPIVAQNLGNSGTNGVGVNFQTKGSTGSILDTGYLAVKKTAVTSTTTTADFIVSLGNATATPTEAFRVKAGGEVVLVGLLALASYTVGTLPSASANAGKFAQVTDSSVAPSGNYGATVAGGGANRCPVFSNGTNWLIC